jgi:hypothetical protein
MKRGSNPGRSFLSRERSILKIKVCKSRTFQGIFQREEERGRRGEKYGQSMF